jgi:hypothetical protein
LDRIEEYEIRQAVSGSCHGWLRKPYYYMYALQSKSKRKVLLHTPMKLLFSLSVHLSLASSNLVATGRRPSYKKYPADEEDKTNCIVKVKYTSVFPSRIPDSSCFETW